MKFFHIKTCCELLKVECDQGRKCPNRTSQPYTINTDSSTHRQWLYNTVLTLVYALAIVATTIVFAGFADYFFGA